MKHLTVFFRHYNDLDHIPPVLYRWLTEEIGSVHAVFMGDAELTEDFRTLFLSAFAGFTYTIGENYFNRYGFFGFLSSRVQIRDYRKP